MAATSFFAQQERARRAGVRLVALYIVAVAAIVASAIAIVIPAYMASAELSAFVDALWPFRPLRLYTQAPAGAYAAIALVTLAVIALGSLEILARLSQGENQLALMLSGRLIGRGSGFDHERRLVNVVDEMAIASGLTAPPLYVLNREQGINAFAAGRSPNRAIVVVTRGALERLQRDELQALIAHEFAHILNGDIQVNLRAACVLQGVVFLSAVGRFMMRYYLTGTEEGRRFFHLPFAAAGAGLYAVGSIGLVFARLIQSAIGREREYLADACAVQYTRNADGLCGALARIGSDKDGSRVDNWHADALGHMLFAPQTRARWFATHPPIEERMRRANPHLEPALYFERIRRGAARAAREEKQQGTGAPESAKPATIAPKRLTAVVALIATIGEPAPEHMEYAAGLLAYLPASVRDALNDAPGAQAAAIGMLLDEEATAAGRQTRALEALGQAELGRRAAHLAPLLRQLGRPYRLPLVALAMPVLRGLTESGRKDFLAALAAVIEADARLTLGEFVVQTIFDSSLRGPNSGGTGTGKRGDHAADIALLLSLLSHAGHPDGAGVEAAFAKGCKTAALPEQALAPREALQLAKVGAALQKLAQLAPLEKEKLLEACGETVTADGNVKLLEHELLRAVACVLECPMPPALGALDPRLLRT